MTNAGVLPEQVAALFRLSAAGCCLLLGKWVPALVFGIVGLLVTR